VKTLLVSQRSLYSMRSVILGLQYKQESSGSAGDGIIET